MKTLFAFAIAAVVVATPVIAAESFNGPYVGGQIGYDNYNLNAEDVLGANLKSLNAHGVEGGAFVGYDWNLSPSSFVGLDASAEISGADFNASNGIDNANAKAKQTFGFSGRAGVLLTKDTALYARIGWAHTKLETELNGVSHWSKNKDGVRLGGGIESYVTQNVSLRIEYTYTDYGHVDTGVKVSSHQTKLGISYRF